MNNRIEEIRARNAHRHAFYHTLDAALKQATNDTEYLLEQLAERDAEIERLREAQRCGGCLNYGQYENEMEYGYPSPCTRCVRRAPDNFMELPAAPEKGE